MSSACDIENYPDQQKEVFKLELRIPIECLNGFLNGLQLKLFSQEGPVELFFSLILMAEVVQYCTVSLTAVVYKYIINYEC